MVLVVVRHAESIENADTHFLTKSSESGQDILEDIRQSIREGDTGWILRKTALAAAMRTMQMGGHRTTRPPRELNRGTHASPLTGYLVSTPPHSKILPYAPLTVSDGDRRPRHSQKYGFLSSDLDR
jgi:hypothetical protein